MLLPQSLWPSSSLLAQWLPLEWGNSKNSFLFWHINLQQPGCFLLLKYGVVPICLARRWLPKLRDALWAKGWHYHPKQRSNEWHRRVGVLLFRYINSLAILFGAALRKHQTCSATMRFHLLAWRRQNCCYARPLQRQCPCRYHKPIILLRPLWSRR